MLRGQGKDNGTNQPGGRTLSRAKSTEAGRIDDLAPTEEVMKARKRSSIDQVITLVLITVVKKNGGQGRNRTADAGLFRAAYRVSQVVWRQRDIIHDKGLMMQAN